MRKGKQKLWLNLKCKNVGFIFFDKISLNKYEIYFISRFFFWDRQNQFSRVKMNGWQNMGSLVLPFPTPVRHFIFYSYRFYKRKFVIPSDKRVARRIIIIAFEIYIRIKMHFKMFEISSHVSQKKKMEKNLLFYYVCWMVYVRKFFELFTYSCT